MIDIPIGLPERGDRACDRQAQQFLGASVFTGARRGLLKFETQAEANEYYRRKSKSCISTQLWSLKKKLQQVDEMIDSGTPAHCPGDPPRTGLLASQ